MAYMSQEHKAKILAQLKTAIPKSWKWSLAVRNHSTIVLNIKSAPVDLISLYAPDSEYHASMVKAGHADVNPYHWQEAFKDHPICNTFAKIFAALNDGNWDRSDSQTDYFDVGHYVAVHVGQWDKPFTVLGG